MTAFGQFSIASGDTIHLNKQDALKVLDQALKANVYQEQRDAYKSEVDSLTKLIDIKQRQIQNLSSQTANYRNIIATYKLEIKALEDQKILYEKQVASLTKQLKKERRKKKWITVAGTAAVGVLVYLYVTK